MTETAKGDDRPTMSGVGKIRIGPAIAMAIGGLMIVVALSSLFYELLLFYQTGSYRMIAAGEFWFTIDVGSLNLAQAVVQRYIYPPLWDPFIVSLLLWPTWSLLGGPGIVLVFAFRLRRRAPS